MMISFELIGYCLLAGAAYLIVIDLIWAKLENLVPVTKYYPPELIEKCNLSWFISAFIIEFIFFVFLPSIIYSWYYTLIPFSGIRGGIAAGMFIVVLGMLPFGLLLLFRLKIPLVFMLYQLLGLLIKAIGTMAIIGYLYAL